MPPKTNALQIICCCNGCSMTPLTDYGNNPIFKGLPTESEYFSTDDERITKETSI